MRRWILGWIVGGALAGFMPLSANAEQYNLACSAGPEGDSHGGDNDDFSVAASYAHDEAGGSESYEAGANLAEGGALFAKAARSGDLATATGSPRAAATFSETIFIDEVPSGPIQIRASFGVNVEATATGGFGAVAQANARLTLNAFAGSCSSTVSANSVSGHEDNSSCSADDSSASASGIVLTVTPETLADFNYQIYIDGNVEAKFEGVAQLDEGNASAAGGAGFRFARSPRGTEVIPGLVYIEIDPPTAHHFVNEQTFFPVPEPGAPLLAAVGAAVLAACRRRAAWTTPGGPVRLRNPASLAVCLLLLLPTSPARAGGGNLIEAVVLDTTDVAASIDDPDALANFFGTEIDERYWASANAAGGELLAQAEGAAFGPLQVEEQTRRARATIGETLTITETPSGPIQIRASIDASLHAMANGGRARAQAGVALLLGGIGCSSVRTLDSEAGFSDDSLCETDRRFKRPIEV